MNQREKHKSQNLKIGALFFIFLLLFIVNLIHSKAWGTDTILVPAGATWKYLDDGSDQGTAWRDSAFDDSSWQSGPAELGYGDGDEATVVGFGPDPLNKYVTTYFRHSFNISDASAFGSATLRILRDDGAVVYLNGTEVMRTNIQGGPITYTTLASAGVSGTDEVTFYETVIDPNLLVNGSNVLAVEIHQVSIESSDVSFNLELIGKSTVSIVPAGATWKYLDDGSDQGTAWRDSAFDDSFWQSGPAELGYGDGDEATVVNCGPSAPACNTNNHITTYFRHSFDVSNASVFNKLTLKTLYDDSIVVYLNGTEVLRKNLSAEIITYNTTAQFNIGGIQETAMKAFVIDPDFLLNGTNVLAVEIHQVSSESSDISFNLELAGDPSFVTRGPYLQTGTPSGVTLRWRTAGAIDSRVRFGIDPNNLNIIIDDISVKTEHEITITDLDPDTKYYYAIGTSTQTFAGGDSEHFFVTSPSIGTFKPTRVWVLGDSGNHDTNAAAVRDAYLSFTGTGSTDVLLMLGDNAYPTGTDDAYQTSVFDMYPGLLRNTILWPALGNHDSEPNGVSSIDGTGPYFDIFTLPTQAEAGGLISNTEVYYSFDYGNIHFINLNSTSQTCDINNPDQQFLNMLDWLADDIAMTNQDWVIAYFHHPPYSKGSHDSDADCWQQRMRENALPILEGAGVDMILSGHSHAYERSMLIDGHYGTSDTLTPDMIIDSGDGRLDGDGAYQKHSIRKGANEGTVYAVVGSSGQLNGCCFDHPAMPFSSFTLGSMVLDVNGNQLDATFIDDVGNILDYLTIIKGSSSGLNIDLFQTKSGTNPTYNTGDLLGKAYCIDIAVPQSVLFEREINAPWGNNLDSEPMILDDTGTICKEMFEEIVGADEINGQYTETVRLKDQGSGEVLTEDSINYTISTP